MLGDVGDPQTIWRLAGKHSLDQIGGRRGLVTGPRTTVARQPLDRCPRHQQFDLVVADLQSEPEGPSSVDPAGPVGAP